MLTLRGIIPRCNQTLLSIEAISLRDIRSIRSCSMQPQITRTTATFTVTRRNFAAEAHTKASKGQEKAQCQRLYYGSLTPRMKAVKVFSLTTSCAGMAAQPILMEQGMKLGGAGMAALFCGFAGFFTFVTPFLLHFITKKYVTELHYNPANDEYMATTISLFLRRIETKFRPSDVRVPAVPGMFTSFFIGKKPFFVDPSLFENTDHYVRIMGYDKPIDFKFDLQENSNTNSGTAEPTKSASDTKTQ